MRTRFQSCAYASAASCCVATPPRLLVAVRLQGSGRRLPGSGDRRARRPRVPVGRVQDGREAEACIEKLETEGRGGLYINTVPVHERLSDWRWENKNAGADPGPRRPGAHRRPGGDDGVPSLGNSRSLLGRRRQGPRARIRSVGHCRHGLAGAGWAAPPSSRLHAAIQLSFSREMMSSQSRTNRAAASEL